MKKYHIIIYVEGENYRTGDQFKISLDDDEHTKLLELLEQKQNEEI